MELTEVIHNGDGIKDDFNPDFFIVASNYEKRSKAVAERMKFSDARKIVLSFKENRTDLSRPSNDHFFKSENFNFIEASAFIPPDFKLIFGEILRPELKIFIDISVMPSLWYHAFFNFIQQQRKCREVFVMVGYVPAVFKLPKRTGNKFDLKKSPKIHSSERSKNKKKRTALVMGLGVEKSIGNKVFEIIKPEITHLLYPDPAYDQSYVENVLINNHEIISKTAIRNLHGYPITDTKQIYSKLIDLIMPLRINSFVTIVPLGTKIFSLMAILIQLTYPDIELFYPQYKLRSLKDREALDEIISVQLCFSVY